MTDILALLVICTVFLGGTFLVCRYIFGPLTFPHLYRPPDEFRSGLAVWALALIALAYALWSHYG